MTFTLDLRLVLAAHAGLAVLLGTLFLATWNSTGRPAFLLAWNGFLVLGMVATALYAARGVLPGGLVIPLATACRLLSWALFWTGVRLLRGRRTPAWVVALPPVLWLAACTIPAFYGSPAARMTLGAAASAGIALGSAIEMLGLRFSASRTRIVRVTAIGAAACGAASLWVAAQAIAGPPPALAGSIGVLPALLLVMMAMLALTLAQTVALEQDAQALQTGAEETERLLAGLPAMVFHRDIQPDGASRRIYLGGDIAAVTGWTPAEMAARRSITDLAAPGTIIDRDFLGSVVRDGSSQVDWRMRRRDGGWQWMRSYGRRLTQRPDGGGEVAGYVLNISAEREAEARSMAVARLASLGEMATGLAHELRQPLAIVSLAAENAQRALARGDIAGAGPRLDRVIDQARRAGLLIEHLRSFARGAELSAAPEPVRLDRAVEGAMVLVGGALMDAGIDVEVALGTPAPAVLGHLVMLEQVLVNLLGNARDAMQALPAEAPRLVRVTVEPDADDRWVRLAVADSGGGIAPEVMPRLFEPFVSTKGADKGTGLGLSISHGLIKAMGGSVEVFSDSQGAVFTLRLRRAEVPGDPMEHPAAPASSDTPVGKPQALTVPTGS